MAAGARAERGKASLTKLSGLLKKAPARKPQ